MVSFILTAFWETGCKMIVFSSAYNYRVFFGVQFVFVRRRTNLVVSAAYSYCFFGGVQLLLFFGGVQLFFFWRRTILISSAAYK